MIRFSSQTVKGQGSKRSHRMNAIPKLEDRMSCPPLGPRVFYVREAQTVEGQSYTCIKRISLLERSTSETRVTANCLACESQLQPLAAASVFVIADFFSCFCSYSYNFRRRMLATSAMLIKAIRQQRIRRRRVA